MTPRVIAIDYSGISDIDFAKKKYVYQSIAKAIISDVKRGKVKRGSKLVPRCDRRAHA